MLVYSLNVFEPATKVHTTAAMEQFCYIRDALGTFTPKGRVTIVKEYTEYDLVRMKPGDVYIGLTTDRNFIECTVCMHDSPRSKRLIARFKKNPSWMQAMLTKRVRNFPKQ